MNLELEKTNCIAQYIYGHADMYQASELPYNEVINYITSDLIKLKETTPKAYEELYSFATNNSDISKLSAESVQAIIDCDNIWYYLEGYVS